MSGALGTAVDVGLIVLAVLAGTLPAWRRTGSRRRCEPRHRRI